MKNETTAIPWKASEFDWKKYPKLAEMFERRPAVNVYTLELEQLITEERANAVRFIADVKAEELTKARCAGYDAAIAAVFDVIAKALNACAKLEQLPELLKSLRSPAAKTSSSEG
jgi:hypothetical protein